MYPEYRDYYLPAFPRSKIENLSNKKKASVIVPVGAIEQHGPHLPVGVDSTLGQAWLNKVLPKVSEKNQIYVAPSIAIGASDEHINFPGTLSLSAKTLSKLIWTTCSQLKEWGFHNIIFFNTHGGNVAICSYTLAEIKETLHLNVALLHWYFRPKEISPKEHKFGIHAGEVETALMYACTEGLVDSSKANCEWIDNADPAQSIMHRRATVTCTWLAEDISESGTMGDATQATLEKGEKWFEEGAQALARQIEEIVSNHNL